VKRIQWEEEAYHSRKQEGDEEIAWQRRKVEVDRPNEQERKKTRMRANGCTIYESKRMLL